MFSSTSCSNCQRPPRSADGFAACPSCGFFRHCSRDCRGADLTHEACCPPLAQLRDITRQLEPPPADDDEGWLDYRRQELMLASLLFGGQLPLVAQNAILWQPACSYCFTTDAPLALCPDCQSVSYCVQHKALVLGAHREACALLEANQRCARLLTAAIAQTGRPPTYLPAREGDTLAAADADSSTSGSSSSSFHFPASWPEFWRWRGCPVGRWTDEEQRCFSSVLTWPATIVHGLRLLQDTGAPLPCPLPSMLRLHLLGATPDCEADCLEKYEELLHCLPATVQRVELVLVGAEMPAGGGGGGEGAAQPRLCKECQDSGRSLSIVLHSGCYHEVLKQRPPAAAAPPAAKVAKAAQGAAFDPLRRAKASASQAAATAAAAAATHASESSTCSSGSGGSKGSSSGNGCCVGGGWEPPHAAFMFNSGLHEDNPQHQQQWLPTVRWLRDAGVATLLTAYTQQEAQQDAAVLERLGCNVVLSPQENAFRGDVPLADCEWRYKVYYINGQLLGFHGKG